MPKIIVLFVLTAITVSCGGLSTRDIIEQEMEALAKREMDIAKKRKKKNTLDDVVRVPMSDFSEVMP